MDNADLTRSDRERIAYDEQGVWERSHAWHVRASHVFECPNTVRHERLFDSVAARFAVNGRVLDIGCGNGHYTHKLRALGANYVLGLDISTKSIAEARASAAGGGTEFRQGDIAEPVEGTYDLICGRAVLHHLEYAPVVRRLYDANLSAGGAMIFMEPLGSNVISFLYSHVIRAAHTRDERSFGRRDIAWFRRTFPDVAVYPYNYLSYPAGIVSSFVSRTPDNAVMRACDRADTWIARHLRVLESRFRYAVFVVVKPA